MSKETFDFSEALRRMRQGKKVRRTIPGYVASGIWLGEDKRIFYKHRRCFHEPKILYAESYNAFFTADDILATDWEEVKE